MRIGWKKLISLILMCVIVFDLHFSATDAEVFYSEWISFSPELKDASILAVQAVKTQYDIHIRINDAEAGTFNSKYYGIVNNNGIDGTNYDGKSKTSADGSDPTLSYGFVKKPNSAYQFATWVKNDNELVTELTNKTAISEETVFDGYFKPTNQQLIRYKSGLGGSISGGRFFESYNATRYFSYSGDAAGATAVPDDGYIFDHWEFNGETYTDEIFPVGSASADGVATAFFREAEKFTITYRTTLDNTYVYLIENSALSGSQISETVSENSSAGGATTYTTAKNRFFVGWYDDQGNLLTDDKTLRLDDHIPARDETYIAVYTNSSDCLRGYANVPEAVTWRQHRANHSSTQNLWASALRLEVNLQFTILDGYDFEMATLNGIVIPASGYSRSNRTYTLQAYINENYKEGINDLIVYVRPGGTQKITYISTAGGTVSNDTDYISDTVNAAGSTAIADDHYVFTGWYDESDALISAEATITNEILQELNIQQDMTLTAKFELDKTIPFTVSVSPSAAYGTVTYHHRGEDLPYLGTKITNDSHQLKNTITARAYENAEFDHWELDGESISTDATIHSGYIFNEADQKLVAVFRKTGNYTIKYISSTGGSIDNTQDTPLNALDTENIKGATATAEDGYQFGGWFEVVDAEKGINIGVTNGEKYNASSTFIPSGDQVRDGVTYMASFRPKDGSKKGIVGYNMNLTGVDVHWDGIKDLVYVTSYGSAVYCDDKEKQYYNQGETITVVNNIPTAEGYKFVTWFDKFRDSTVDGVRQEQASAMRNGGDTCKFITGNATSYTFDAIWIHGSAPDQIFAYDQTGHMTQATAELVLGSMTSDVRWATELEGFKNSFYIKKNAAGQDDIQYRIIAKDGVPMENGPSGADIQVTEPGVYTVQAIFTVVYQVDENTTREFKFDDVTATITILPKTVTIVKEWQDDDNAAALRPDSLGIMLKQDDSILELASWEIDEEENTWTAIYTGLPFKNGETAILYTASEPTVPEHYTLRSSAKQETLAYQDVLHDSSLTNDTFTFVNQIRKTPLTIRKLDESGDTIQDASFHLEMVKNANNTKPSPAPTWQFTAGTQTVQLVDGYYRLTETEPPIGRIPMEGSLYIHVSNGAVTLMNEDFSQTEAAPMDVSLQGNQLSVTNRWLKAEVTIPGVKILKGKPLEASQFTFVLTPENGSSDYPGMEGKTSLTAVNTLTMDSEGTYGVDQIGRFQFTLYYSGEDDWYAQRTGEISYFYYLVSEQLPDGAKADESHTDKGIQYDDSQFLVRVALDGALNIAVTIYPYEGSIPPEETQVLSNEAVSARWSLFDSRL